MKTKKIIVIFGLFLVLMFLTGCTSKIADVKNEENVDKTVTISGINDGSIKLGTFSGYTVKDDTGSIFVSSTSLPADGDKVKVSGTVKTFLGQYYIDAK